MKNIICGIYCIKNKINGKVYIGRSLNIHSRWKDHLKMKNDSQLTRAFKKYGIDNFEFSILEECDQTELNNREIHYISFFDSKNKFKGYNLTKGGEGGLSWNDLPNGNPCFNMSVETLEKMSNQQKIRNLDPKERQKHQCPGEKNGRWHKPLSEQSKEIVRQKSKQRMDKIKEDKELTQKMFGDPNKGKKWWTNGTISHFQFICPEGFYPGRQKSISVKISEHLNQDIR